MAGENEYQDERVGAYRILRAIGQGRMGAVYLAVRDDDQYRQQVAVKVVKPGTDTDDVLRRFRRERQILAGLEHPYIARLLDGGSTHEGRPFLVMELVEGQPITAYCRQRHLGREARLHLFLKVCEAVAFAHRNLVVHRDLKPANILITGEGEPKLLDFGLARILEETDDRTHTLGALTPLTPEYASPEQIHGGELSTATDIYSLGVTLYQLLTNELPGGGSGKLRGDLENIAMLALREEPERRYRSVDELAADIRNYLEMRPVRARPDSPWYRAGKFARRRRYALLAGAGVVASLVTGMLLAIGQTRSAEAARRMAMARQAEAQHAGEAAQAEHRRAEQDRDLAITSRHVAEERVTQMVDLSDRSLSQVYDLMERLAGGIPARRELIQTTLDFLQRLSQDVGPDERLRVALAKAYSRLGDIQSDANGAPFGGWEGALESYRAGSALLEDLAQTGERGDGLLVWLDLQEKTAILLGEMGRGPQAPGLLRRAIAVVEQIPDFARDKGLMRRRGCLYLALSKETHTNYAGALPTVEKSIGMLAGLARAYPDDPELRYDLSRAYTERAYLLVNLQGLDGAWPDYLRTIELREQLVEEHPSDTVYRRVLMGAYGHAAQVSRTHHPDVARGYMEKAMAIAQQDAADPQNIQAAGDYGEAVLNLAELDAQTGDHAAALAGMRRSREILEPVVAVALRSPFAMTLSEAHEQTGEELTRAGDGPGALVEFRSAQAAAGRYAAAYPSESGALRQFVTASRRLVQALGRAGERQNAFDEAIAVVKRAEQPEAVVSNGALQETARADAYLCLAGAARDLGLEEQAQTAAREAMRHAEEAARLSGRVPNAAQMAEARALTGEGQ